jgi:hypothetical protein
MGLTADPFTVSLHASGGGNRISNIQSDGHSSLAVVDDVRTGAGGPLVLMPNKNARKHRSRTPARFHRGR